MFESPENRNVKIGKRIYKLELTCSVCPEQWDVYRDCAKVGYIRLRHGDLRVDYPDCGGKTLLDFCSGTYGDGFFDTEELRNFYLLRLVKAIDEEILDQNPSLWRRFKKKAIAFLGGTVTTPSPMQKPTLQ